MPIDSELLQKYDASLQSLRDIDALTAGPEKDKRLSGIIEVLKSQMQTIDRGNGDGEFSSSFFSVEGIIQEKITHGFMDQAHLTRLREELLLARIRNDHETSGLRHLQEGVSMLAGARISKEVVTALLSSDRSFLEIVSSHFAAMLTTIRSTDAGRYIFSDENLTPLKLIAAKIDGAEGLNEADLSKLSEIVDKLKDVLKIHKGASHATVQSSAHAAILILHNMIEQNTRNSGVSGDLLPRGVLDLREKKSVALRHDQLLLIELFDTKTFVILMRMAEKKSRNGDVVFTDEEQAQLQIAKKKVLLLKNKFVWIYTIAKQLSNDQLYAYAMELAMFLHKYERWMEKIYTDSITRPTPTESAIDVIGPEPKLEAGKKVWKEYFLREGSVGSSPSPEKIKEKNQWLREWYKKIAFVSQESRHPDNKDYFAQFEAYVEATRALAENESRDELFYVADFAVMDRHLLDFHIVYANGASATNPDQDKMDEMRGNRGAGFNALDFFAIPKTIVPLEKMTVENPQPGGGTRIRTIERKRYEYQALVENGLDILALFYTSDIGDPYGKYCVAKFVESENTYDNIVADLVVELEKRFPEIDRSIIKEAADITYRYACVTDMRTYFATSELAAGATLQGRMRDGGLVDIISACNPVAAEMYNLTAKRIWSRLFTMVDIPKKWFEKMEKKQKFSKLRLDAIKASIALSRAAAKRWAPLRKPSHVHFGKYGEIRSIYPQFFEFATIRRLESWRNGANFSANKAGRANFEAFHHAIEAKLPVSSDGLTNKQYRHAIARYLESDILSKISALKTNIMIDWKDVADSFLGYIDMIFRVYSGKDKSKLGAVLLHMEIMKVIRRSSKLEINKVIPNGDVHNTYNGFFMISPNLTEDNSMGLREYLIQHLSLWSFEEGKKNWVRIQPGKYKPVEHAVYAKMLLLNADNSTFDDSLPEYGNGPAKGVPLIEQDKKAH